MGNKIDEDLLKEVLDEVNAPVLDDSEEGSGVFGRILGLAAQRDDARTSARRKGARLKRSQRTRLQALVDSNDVYVEGNAYVGIAADGTEVQIGTRGDEDSVEAYLRDRPTPEDW